MLRSSFTLPTVLLPLVLCFGLLHAVPLPDAPRIRSEPSPAPDAASSHSANVTFTACTGESLGKVTSMEITPCQRKSTSEPCTFQHGHNYTLSLGFVSYRNSTNPRSSVVAQDGPQSYAYSGQSFNGCRYAPCPIVANEPSTYVYNFHVLKSPFNHLTFNVSDDFTGPSLFCAGTEIRFEP